MANHSSVLRSRCIGYSGAAVVFALMFVAGGCQQQPATVEQLPPANFNGPVVVAPPPAPVEAPKPAVPKPQAEVKPKAPPSPLAGIPRDWTPSARANDWKWIVIHHSATPAGG